MAVYMQLFDADMSSKPEDMYRSRFLRSNRLQNVVQTPLYVGSVRQNEEIDCVHGRCKAGCLWCCAGEPVQVWGREGSRGPV